MATCTSCGNDVTGKKFCPECGTPVQPATPPTNVAAEPTCPRCNSVNNPGASFCINCGSALTAPATTTAQSQPLTHRCPACNTDVPASLAFCTNCGHSMQAAPAMPATAVASMVYCNNCGRQNNSDVRFCGGCGSPLATGTPAPMGQTSYAQPEPYGQPSQYGQPNSQPGYQQPYGQQPGYQQYQQPMMGQQPMVLHCPICMAMSPVGTTNCPGCHSSLAGVVPTPAMMPQQGQQQGGFGGLFQGSGGNMAMGAMGGAAAVIGGEMLLHGLEREHDRGYGYERRDDGLLGDLGGLANDIGLF